MRLNRQLSKSRQRLAGFVLEYNKLALALDATQILENANETTIWPWIRGGKLQSYFLFTIIIYVISR